MSLREMIEQTHPKCREGLVIKIDKVITRREVKKLLAHARKRARERESFEIT